MNEYILVAYKKENGIMRNFEFLAKSKNKEELEWIMDCERPQELKEKGYIVEIYKKEE